LDLKKAFDTIDHVILLKKLNTIGVRGVAAELLRNYLTNRLQIVCVNGKCSSFLPVSVGVPQGSVLGSLLFLIYINDIGSFPLQGSQILFADDTAIFYPCLEVTELVESVHANLTRLKRYFTANKLTLNTDKTSYLVFRALNKK
jgi:ribonucleases P/MRP protein subunit RPP40